MARMYHFDVGGEAADGQTWKVTGIKVLERGSDFPSMMLDIMRHAFLELTEGRAVFGQPGKGCAGPYSMKNFNVEAITGRAPDAP